MAILCGDTIRNSYLKSYMALRTRERKGGMILKGTRGDLWNQYGSAAAALLKNEAHCKLDFTPAQQWSPQLNKCVPAGSQEGFRVVRGFEDKNSLRSAPFN